MARSCGFFRICNYRNIFSVFSDLYRFFEINMTKACPSCNQLNPPDAAFCLNCSASLAPAPHIGAQPNQQWQQPPVGGPLAGNPIALVLAIAALICCGPVAGVPASIVGWMELDAIKNGRSPASGKWMAQVGLWVGIASSVIHVVVYMIWVLFSAMASSNPYGY